MTVDHSSQKFIARHRAPRVQIEYDVESYGAGEKVALPFVMGVMADLGGKDVDAQSVADRRFLDIDVDNFSERMRAKRPRLSILVPDLIGDSGHLSLSLEFRCLDDFAPAAIARQIAPLRALLEARTRLANLQTYMDGKCGAESLVGKVLNDPALLRMLSAKKRALPPGESAA